MSTTLSLASARLKTENGSSFTHSRLFESERSFSSRDFKSVVQMHSKIDSSLRRVESQQKQLLSLREPHLQLLPTFLNISKNNQQRISNLISTIMKEDADTTIKDADTTINTRKQTQDLRAGHQQSLQRQMHSRLNSFKSKLKGVWIKVSDNNEKYMRYLTNRLQVLTEEARLKVEATQDRFMQEVGNMNRKFKISYEEIGSSLISKAFTQTFKPEFNQLETKLGMLYNEVCFSRKESHPYYKQSTQNAQMNLLHQTESLRKRIELLKLKQEQLNIETETVAKKLARKTKLRESLRIRAFLNKMETDRVKNRQQLERCQKRQTHLAEQKRGIEIDWKGLRWMEEQLGGSEVKGDIEKSRKVKAKSINLLEQLNSLSNKVGEKIRNIQIQ